LTITPPSGWRTWPVIWDESCVEDLLDGLLGERLVGDVAAEDQAVAAFVLDPPGGRFRVLVLVGAEVDDRHVGALAGEQDGGGAADAAVAPVMRATLAASLPLPRWSSRMTTGGVSSRIRGRVDPVLVADGAAIFRATSRRSTWNVHGTWSLWENPGARALSAARSGVIACRSSSKVDQRPRAHVGEVWARCHMGAG